MGLRMLAKVGVSAGIAVMLAACGGDKPIEPDKAEVQPLYMLSADGVGPLNADTPFNLIRIGDAFQDFNVAQETHFAEGEKYPVITVKQQVKPLLSINPDFQQKNIFSIIVHDKLIGNKLGHALGTRFADIYTYGKTEECGPGLEEWAGKVMCYAPQTGNILYLFAGKWDGPDGKVPPMEVLANWQLEAMIWKPPAKK